ncbi:hypothetical protein BG004_006790 [Podila humilis]|nr:hypothetical protein BG004_006790 [Podila humilis]
MAMGAMAALTLSFLLALLEPISAQSPSSGIIPPSVTLTTDFILPTTAPTPLDSPPPNTPVQCPGPLIPNTKNLSIATCINGCCLRCPAIESFYEPNVVQNVLKTAYVTRQVSLGFSVFLAVSYLILPGKRAQPHISVLFLTVSLSLWYVAFDMMPGISNACIDEFQQSTNDNSKLCGAQGTLIIYLTQTSALWCSLLIYKLHLLAVWRLDFIDRHYRWFTAFCWVFPLVFAIPVAAKGIAEFPGIGFSCLVGHEYLNTYLFYPTAIYMYPAMLCHVITVAKMVQLAIMSSKIDTGLSQLSIDARMKITTTMQAKRLLRGQWRPALMAGAAMASLTVFWLFYFVDAKRASEISPTQDWVIQWMGCVLQSAKSGKSADEVQTICAKLVASHMPSIPWFTAAEMLLALLGVVVAMVFVSKNEFWQDWSFLLSNLLSRGKMGNNSRGRRTPGGQSASPTMNNHANSPALQSPRFMNDYNEQDFVHSPEKTYFQSNQRISRSGQHRKGTPGTQWYDMDDLLDKEYDEKTHNTEQLSNLHRNASYGASRGSDPTRHPVNSNQDPHIGDTLYRPIVQEANSWTPSADALSSPSYLTPSNSDRYVEQPVVPQPVPRASIKSKASHQQEQQSQVFLSSHPQSPKFTQQPTTPLSPMPSKPLLVSGGALPRQLQSLDEMSYTSTSTARGPSSTARNVPAYSSNESGDKIMMASRESQGTSKGVNRAVLLASDSIRVNTTADRRAPSGNADPHGMSQPPAVPAKSPARQNQGYISPPLQIPSSYNTENTGSSFLKS